MFFADTAEALYVQFLSDRTACGAVYNPSAAFNGHGGGKAVYFSFGLCATAQDVQAVLDTLVGAPWDSNSSDSITEARLRIVRLCRLDSASVESADVAILGEVVVTVAKKTKSTSTGAGVNKPVLADELDSYVALVRDAGKQVHMILPLHIL